MSTPMLFIFGMVLLWGFTSSQVVPEDHPHPEVMGHTINTKPKDGIKNRCTQDEECPTNFRCGGRSKNRCVECVDCSKYQRKSKNAYDGQFCAKSYEDCGPCNEGFQELGGQCYPMGTTATSTSPPVLIIDAFRHTNTVNNEETVTEANSSWLPIVGGLLMGMFVCTGVGYLIIYKCGPRFAQKRDTLRRTPREEEAGLTSTTYTGPGYEQPTAPPAEEYNRQPAYANQLFGFGMSRPSVTDASNAGASRFERDERGEWVRYPDVTDDVVDGGGRGNVAASDVGINGNQPQMHHEVPQSNSNVANRVVPPRQPRSQRGRRHSGVVPFNAATFSHPQDPVQGQVRFFFQAGFHASTPMRSAPSPPQQTNTAPVSPVPMFESSSLDSGTGASEGASRSFPSLSASGNDIRDEHMDDSMFDDDRRPPPRDLVPVVPNLDNNNDGHNMVPQPPLPQLHRQVFNLMDEGYFNFDNQDLQHGEFEPEE